METFSEWLANELIQRKMTQADLARASGVTNAQISRVISGSRGIGEASISAIAHGLNLPPDLVFEKAGILPPKPGNLSEEQQQVIHLVTQVSDQKTLRMISAMLDQALEEKDREKPFRR